jgi:hypothetical protein
VEVESGQSIPEPSGKTLEILSSFVKSSDMKQHRLISTTLEQSTFFAVERLTSLYPKTVRQVHFSLKSPLVVPFSVDGNVHK